MTYEEFVDARLAVLARYAAVLTGDPHLAQDLVQETMVRCQLAWRKVAAADSPERYVKRMMVNLYLDWRRGSWFRRVFLRSETDDAVRVPADHAERNADRDLIWQALARLPAPVRSMHREGVVYPKGCHELSGQEVADLLRQRKGMPLGALDRDDNAHRALAGLLEEAADLDVVRLAGLSRIDGVTFDLTGDLELASLLSLRDEIDLAAVVGLGQPSFDSEVNDGRVYEVLSQPAGAELFQALRQDTLDRFAAAHADWITDIHCAC